MKWKPIDWDECPECGAEVEVYTREDLADGEVCDADNAKCRECGLRGSVSADGDGAWINWEGEGERNEG